jgi:hypothetical protein
VNRTGGFLFGVGGTGGVGGFADNVGVLGLGGGGLGGLGGPGVAPKDPGVAAAAKQCPRGER